MGGAATKGPILIKRMRVRPRAPQYNEHEVRILPPRHAGKRRIEAPAMPLHPSHAVLIIPILLEVGLTSCTLLPPRRPLGTPTPRPRPTSTPSPLASAFGSASGAIPHLVAAGPWQATWQYACTGPRWFLRMEAHPTRRNVRPSTVGILDARPPAPRSGHGTTSMPDRGNLYITIHSSGCRWRLTALP